jgi:integrase
MPNNENHALALTFIAASGLRISELQALYVRDIILSPTGTLWIRVTAEDVQDERKREERKRTAPILASYKQDILAALAGRQPDEKVFPDFVRKRLAGEARLRKQYARAFYCELNELVYGLDEPLDLDDYYEPAVYAVSYALGECLGVTMGTYLALFPETRL